MWKIKSFLRRRFLHFSFFLVLLESFQCAYRVLTRKLTLWFGTPSMSLRYLRTAGAKHSQTPLALSEWSTCDGSPRKNFWRRATAHAKSSSDKANGFGGAPAPCGAKSPPRLGPCFGKFIIPLGAIEGIASGIVDSVDAIKDYGRGLAPFQSRIESEVISPTAIAGGNAGLVLCQVGGQYSGQ